MIDNSAFLPSQAESPFESSTTSSKAAARAARRKEKADKEAAKTVKALVARTPNQQIYIDILRRAAAPGKSKRSVIAVGPAGTGKTYLPARIATQGLTKGEFDKIILTRVPVAKKEYAMGFLPGNADAKMKPWVIPILDGIKAEISGVTLDKLKQEGRIEIVPFEHMRGRTFAQSFIILDEAQNAAFDDLTLFLTRTGEGSQVVVCGDLDQCDIPNSGLPDIARLAQEFSIMDVVRFTEDDVVRSEFAKLWVKAIAKHKARKGERSATPLEIPTASQDAPDSNSFLDNAPAFLKVL